MVTFKPTQVSNDVPSSSDLEAKLDEHIENKDIHIDKDTRDAINEVYDLTKKYKNDKNKLNEETIKLFIKYDIITEENVQKLREKGKL